MTTNEPPQSAPAPDADKPVTIPRRSPLDRIRRIVERKIAHEREEWLKKQQKRNKR